MSFFDEFPFDKQKIKKNTTNTFGPWIQPEPRSFQRSPLHPNSTAKPHFNSFLQSIKTPKRKHKNQPNLWVPHQEAIKSQISQQIKQSPQESKEIIKEERKVRVKKKKNENDVLNTTIYYYHYNTEQKEIDVVNKWNSVTDREHMPRKKWTGGSQNLQRILKMKDKLREKNKSVIKKTKERFQYRNEEPLKLEMEGIKKETRLQNYNKRKERKEDRQITRLFYQTIENMAKERRGKKTPEYL